MLALVNWVITSLARQTFGGKESLARETGQSLHRLVCPAQLAKHLVKGHTIGTTIGYTHTLPQTLSGGKEGEGSQDYIGDQFKSLNS